MRLHRTALRRSGRCVVMVHFSMRKASCSFVIFKDINSGSCCHSGKDDKKQSPKEGAQNRFSYAGVSKLAVIPKKVGFFCLNRLPRKTLKYPNSTVAETLSCVGRQYVLVIFLIFGFGWYRTSLFREPNCPQPA